MQAVVTILKEILLIQLQIDQPSEELQTHGFQQRSMFEEAPPPCHLTMSKQMELGNACESDTHCELT